MNKQYAIALAGLETIKRDDGSIKHFSQTFLNNVLTFKKDNAHMDVEIVDARDFWEFPKPMSALWERLRVLSEDRPIDLLMISSHSGPEQLYFFSKVRKDVPEEERYFCMTDKWEDIEFSKDAKIELHGCQAAGMHGEKFVASIAQSIADATKVPTYGYLWKTSQKKIGDKFYQVPDHGKLVKCDPISLASGVLEPEKSN